MSDAGPLLLAGGGHSHALLLKRWAMQPQRRPSRAVLLVNRRSTALYSGMVPGLIAGSYRPEELAIDLRSLCERAGVAFIAAEIEGVDLNQRNVLLRGRPALGFSLLSLNVGAVSRRTAEGTPIKPLEPALAFLQAQDANPTEPFRVIGAGAAGLEVVLALRRRWPHRPLQLQIRAGQALPGNQRRVLQRATIELVTVHEPASGPVLLCTGSCAPSWLADSGLPVQGDGRIRTDASLTVRGEVGVFACGDCACIDGDPRPPSGVWAVRAAPVLARNLEAACSGQALRPWRPQPRALQLIGDPSGEGPPRAMAQWSIWQTRTSELLWRWKERIDRRFMDGFRSSMPMQQGASMACRGCAAKLPAEPLAMALDQAGLSTLARSPQDAAVLGGSPLKLQSVDGFPALVSDPWLNGRLTTLHACSDLWASGADVSSAMAVITLPAVNSSVQRELLSQTLAGIQSALEPQGAALIGGHTLESRSEPPIPPSLGLQVSLSVNGEADRLWAKGGIQAGDCLLMSRPIGTGVLFAAAMAGAAQPGPMDAVLAAMSTSQHTLLASLRRWQDAIHACTDITGFGLLGHLEEMLQCSNPALRLTLEGDRIKAFDGALRLLAAGYASSLAPSNRSAWRLLDTQVTLKGRQDSALLELLVDPQTCGPLLVACSQAAAESLTALGPWTQIGTAGPLHG